MKFYALFLQVVVLLFTELALSGQNDFKNGFVISYNNDTVYGFINLNTNITNGRVCEFRQSADKQTTIRYSPLDIKAYNIENQKFYVSKRILLDSVETVVFLEYLVDGIVDLYFYRDFNIEQYFIEKEGEMYLLKNEVRETRSKGGGIRYQVNSNHYKWYIKSYVSG